MVARPSSSISLAAVFLGVSGSAFTFLLLFLPPGGQVPPRAIVNVESTIAVGFLLAICLRCRSFPPGERGLQRKVPVSFGLLEQPGLLFTSGAIALPFLITVRAPFLYDSYAHIVRASHQQWTQVLSTFYVHPTVGDFFFRPLGYLAYWLEAKWSGLSFWRWHADGIVLHLLAVVLLYLLARQLEFARLGCWVAILVFGFYGGNPEVVAWEAARFDELCVCFVLLSLVFVCRYASGGDGLVVSLVAALCAMLSKEAAFCLPVLIISSFAFRPLSWTRCHVRALLGSFGLAVVVLCYRTWVVRGVGGYGAVSGMPLALHFSPWHLLELLLFRMWAVLLFPLNWSVHPGVFVVLASFAGLLFLALCIALSRPDGRRISAALAFCVLALLPASWFAMLDASLLGARLYHLSSIGWALLFAVIVEGMPAWTSRYLPGVAVALLLSWQASTLCHNLVLWRHAAELAGKTCALVPTLVDVSKPVRVVGLPSAYNGIPFLFNAFPECVLVNSGRVVVPVPVTDPQAVRQELMWDSGLRVLKRSASH